MPHNTMRGRVRLDQQQIALLVVIVVVGVIVIGLSLSARRPPTTLVSERALERQDDLFFSYEVVRYPTHIEVITDDALRNLTLGFNIDTDQLFFGKVPGNGGTSKRHINLTSRGEAPALITMEAHGPIAPLIVFSEPSFLLRDQALVSVTADTGSHPSGNYTGEIDVVIQRSKSSLLRGLLGY